jgi:hypothetical protein
LLLSTRGDHFGVDVQAMARHGHKLGTGGADMVSQAAYLEGLGNMITLEVLARIDD